MKKRFTDEQIIGFLKEAEAGMKVKDLCRRHGFSEPSYYAWKSKFGGMTVPDAKRLRELETENGRLKKLLAESILENEVLVQFRAYPDSPSCHTGSHIVYFCDGKSGVFISWLSPL